MHARLRVLLLDRRQPLLSQFIREPNQGWPQTPMDESNLPIHESETQHLGRVVDRAESLKNLGALLVAPPASTNRLTGDRFRQIWNRPFRRGQDDSMPSDELHRVEDGFHVPQHRDSEMSYMT